MRLIVNHLIGVVNDYYTKILLDVWRSCARFRWSTTRGEKMFQFTSGEIKSALRNGEDTKCVVRVTKSSFVTNGKLRLVTDVYTLKRKSKFDALGEEISAAGDDAILSIVNLDDVDSGVYKLVYCDVRLSSSYSESDDWSLKLVPYDE